MDDNRIMTDAEAERNRAMLDLEIKNLSNMDLKNKISPKYWNVPFVNEVEEFNSTFGKPNNYEPTIPERKEFFDSLKINNGGHNI